MKKKNISKRISQISSFILCVSKRQPQLFFFFFSSNGRASILLRSLSFFHFFFFVEGSRLVNCGMPIVLFFLGCVFDLIFFFLIYVVKVGMQLLLGVVVCMCDEYYSRHLII